MASVAGRIDRVTRYLREGEGKWTRRDEFLVICERVLVIVHATGRRGTSSVGPLNDGGVGARPPTWPWRAGELRVSNPKAVNRRLSI